MSAAVLALLAFTAGCVLERWRGAHRLAQIVDVDAVRAETIDRDAVEQQLAEQTMRAAQFHRWWRIAQQVARQQAELLASRGRRPIPLGPSRSDHSPRHLRSAVPGYGPHRRSAA